MAELTLEQRRALALARARVRVQQQQTQRREPPKKPEEGGVLQDIKDVGASLGLAAVNLAKPFADIATRVTTTSPFPALFGAGLLKAEDILKGGLSEADVQREQEKQRVIAEEVQAPGALARGIAATRQFIEGPKRPEAARTPLSGIADYLSPTRVIASVLPETPEAAQREISGVTTEFSSPVEAAQFAASQIPATAATVLAGGLGRGAALASGLGRQAAAQTAQRAAVGTGVALNSSDAGYSAAQAVLDKGGTREEADRAFLVAAGGAALASAAASKIPGLEQNLFSTQALRPGIIRGAARSAAGEAPQEFVEEAGAQLAQNIGVLGTAAERDISEGVLSSGALGLIGGTALAAPTGAIQGYQLKREAAAAPPPPPPGAEGEPIRTTTVAFENKEDPANPTIRTFDVMSEPDEDGLVTVRDETGRAFEITAARLGEQEALAEAYTAPTAAPAPTPTIDPATISTRLRLASGVQEGQKEPPRVTSLAREITDALAVDDDIAAQNVINARLRALAASRMSETTRAQRQAEFDEAQSIVNDYRAERGLARAAPAARIEAPTVESEAEAQARAQNEELARQEAAAEAERAAAERARLERESALESASLIGQASPIRQAQTERQQLFDAIINDDTVENPAAAFRQVLRERGYPSTELNEAERRQVRAKLAFTKPAGIVPFTGEEITPEVIEPAAAEPEVIEGEFTEVPAPLPAAPPEVVAGAQQAGPSRRAQLLAGAAMEPGAPPAVAFGEEAPAPSRMAPQLLGEPMTEEQLADFDARREARNAAREKLIEELKKFGFKDITVIVRDLLEGGEAGGTYDPMDSIIRVAMRPDGEMMASVLHHELIHYLKDHGFFTDKEWTAVLKAAKRDLIMRGIIEYAYRGETRANKDEEIVAEYFRNWLGQQAEGFQPSNTVLGKIRRFLLAIQEFFSSQGFRDAEAVLEAIRNGEFATREDKGSAKRAAYYAGTAEKPGRMPIYAGRGILEPREGEQPYQAEERRIIGNYYQVAQDMENAGANPAEIRVATGWERNPYDNEWRYLQSDEVANETAILDDFVRDYDFASDAYNMTLNPDGSFDLGDLMRHSELYSLYPEARNIKVFLQKSGGRSLQGSYDSSDKSITLYADAVDPLGTLLHEVQHWVQDKEGFAFGSSPSTVWDALSDDQKRVEAQASVDVLNSDIEELTGAMDVLEYLSGNPEFEMAVEDGTALQDLDGFFEQAFNDGIIVDDKIYALVTERLQDIVSDQAALGLADPSLTMENVQDELASVREEIDAKNQLIEDIKDGDPTEEGSAAEEAARTAFEDHTRRNVIRYLDTAGEIEARDVTASRRLGQQELRERGMLKTERAPRAGAVVVTRRAEGPSASIAPQPNVAAEPEPAKMGRLRELYNRIRIGKAWSNIGSQFSSARAGDQWVARSLGLKKMPDTDSFYSAFETYLSKKNGMLQRLRLDYVDPLTDAISDAIKNGVTLDMLNDYIQARGAAERNAAIAQINEDMPDGGSGITDARAEEMLLELELSGKMRDILRVAKLHDRLRDRTQQIMVDSGLVSAETMADWKKKYPNYTPYKGRAPAGDMTVDGQEDPHADYGAYEGGQPVYSRVAGTRAKPVKKAEGRSSQAANSIYNMIADAEMFLEMGQRNEISLKFEEAYKKDPAAFEGLMKVYDEKNPKFIKGKAQKITDEKAYKQAVRGFKKGKPFIMEMAPNEEGSAVYRAFQNLNAVQLWGWVQKFLSVMSVMRGVHTRFNAAFWPREFLRSVSDAAGNVFAERGREASAAYGKKAAMKTWMYSWDPTVMAGVFSHLVNRSPENERVLFNKMLTDEMVENGGAAGQEFAQRAERVAQRMEQELKRLTATGVKAGYFETKEGLKKLMDAVDGINDFVDLVPRVAAYKALTEAGLTPQQAAPIALRSTLDLTKRGRFGQVIDGIFWWTTPSLTNLTNKISRLDSSTYRKLLVAQLAIGFGLGMLNVMNAPDSDDDGEDDYSQMPEWRKLAYLHVYYSPDEKPFTLPVGFLFMFERYVGGKMAEVLMGKASDGKAAVDIMTAAQQIGTAFLSSLSPVVRSTEARTLVPSSIAPMYDLAVNESFFKAPIYMESKFNEEEAKASRAKPSTPEFYKFIARQLQERTDGYGRIPGGIDVSPDQLKYFVDQYAGGVGRLVGGAANADVEALKKLNPFYFDPKLTEYSPMSRFYEREGEMKNAIAAKKLEEDGDDSELEFLENTKPYTVDDSVVEAYKTAEKDLKELRKEDIPFEEYNARRLEIMAEFNKEYNAAKGER